LAAVPGWAIERAARQGAESAWTDPERIVTSGAFLLKQRSQYEQTVVVRNHGYYEAGLVRLEQIEFIPVADGVTTANLYRAGEIDAMPGERLSPLLARGLERYVDYQATPACFVIWYGFNIRKPPFDNVLVRYALNMATDKAAIAGAFGGGRRPGRTVIPAIEGYDAPQSLPVVVDGVTYDVLAFDPAAARVLLAKAGYPEGIGSDGRRLNFEMLFPGIPHSRPIAEMLHHQWRTNLEVEPKLTLREFNVWDHVVRGLEYKGLAEWGGWPDYVDPRGFFDWFEKGSSDSGTGYADSSFDQLLAESDALADPQLRMQKLADCERHLLKSMPVIPVYHNVWIYLQKPFVRRLGLNALDKHPFKYAWIDTNWRPA
jgi:oligopeptide transport system substrate-binding protein